MQAGTNRFKKGYVNWLNEKKQILLIQFIYNS